MYHGIHFYIVCVHLNISSIYCASKYSLMSRSFIHLAGTKSVHLLITDQVKIGGCGIFCEARTSVASFPSVRKLLASLEKVCGVLREGTEKTLSSFLTLKPPLNFRSALFGCVLPLLHFQGFYSFVGFLKISKPPFSQKPTTQYKNFYLIWQNTKAKVNIYR